jgi:threonine synthase
MQSLLSDHEKSLFISKNPVAWITSEPNSRKYTTAEVVQTGISPQGFLFFPETIPQFTQAHYDYIRQSNFSQAKIAILLMNMVFGEIPNFDTILLKKWTDSNMDLSIDPIHTSNNEFGLNLGTGPTRAFKDYAATVLSSLSEAIGLDKIILVATSGDTGGAIANAFASDEDSAIPVIVFYPKGRVSDVQRKYITTTGKKNIYAIEIDGSFDDCQDLVKLLLKNNPSTCTTANSINPARCYSQIIQFALMTFELEKMGLKPTDHDTILGIPSGNFGHATAASFWQLMTRELRDGKGLIDKLVLARNINGLPGKEKSELTLSSAMDVVRPNNLPRFQMYDTQIQNKLGHNWSVEEIVTDEETGLEMTKTLEVDDYLLDPHSATARSLFKRLGYLSAGFAKDIKISVQTANPSKLPDEVMKYTGFDQSKISQYTGLSIPFDGTKKEVFTPYSNHNGFDLNKASHDIQKIIDTISKS